MSEAKDLKHFLNDLLGFIFPLITQRNEVGALL